MNIGQAQRVDEVEIGDRHLEVGCWGPGVESSEVVPVVLCHDGLGAFATFGDIPGQISQTLNAATFAVNRAGHGRSTPVPSGPWPLDWLQREAEVLVELLERLVGDRPVHLVGHSDGGSIVLLAALAAPDRVKRITAFAPHSWVEPKCNAAIRQMRGQRERLVAGLARIHEAPGELFAAWSGVWVSEGFETWDIRDRLGAVAQPVTIVQGDADEYATDAMLWETVGAVGDNASGVLKPGWPHLMNRTNPKEMARLVIDLHSVGD